MTEDAPAQELLAAIGQFSASLSSDQRATATGLLEWWWEWADTQWPVQELAARTALLHVLREPPAGRRPRKSTQRHTAVPPVAKAAAPRPSAALEPAGDGFWLEITQKLREASVLHRETAELRGRSLVDDESYRLLLKSLGMAMEMAAREREKRNGTVS